MTAASNLKKTHKEFESVLEKLANCDMAKTGFLQMTFSDTLKYNQLVQNLRSKEDYTYGDVVANL